MFLLYNFFEINYMIYALLLIPFLKMYFRHLITLYYKTQNDIYIFSKFKKNIFINFFLNHFIYWHTTIHYNYSNVRLKKIQSYLL